MSGGTNNCCCSCISCICIASKGCAAAAFGPAVPVVLLCWGHGTCSPAHHTLLPPPAHPAGMPCRGPRGSAAWWSPPGGRLWPACATACCSSASPRLCRRGRRASLAGRTVSASWTVCTMSRTRHITCWVSEWVGRWVGGWPAGACRACRVRSWRAGLGWGDSDSDRTSSSCNPQRCCIATLAPIGGSCACFPPVTLQT